MYYYRSQHFNTGSPKALAAMIGLLDRTRFEPLYLATGAGPLTETLAAQNVEIVQGDVTSVTYRRPLAALRRTVRQARLLDSLKVDLLHVNDFGWNDDLVLGAWVRRIPVVCHIHNPISIRFRNFNRLATKRFLIVSDAHKVAVAHFERIRRKCDVLYNSIDIDEIQRGRSIRDSLGLSVDDIVIGTIGQVSHGKGVDVLLQAARMLSPRWDRVRLVFIGPERRGQARFADDMMKLAEEPDLAGRVQFLGSRSDVPDLLASMDVFVLPTRAEALPIVILEAMAAGVPVVASRVGGIPEMITSSDTGWLVDPITPEAFATAIAEVLQLEDRGRSVGQRGSRSLRGRFDHATVRERLQGVYDELLRRP
jgi:glycosyltransferase involved in cell wall biosynthesis